MKRVLIYLNGDRGLRIIEKLIECNYKYGGNNGKIIMTVRPMSDNLIIIDWLITWLSRFSFKNHQKFFKILGLPVYLK